MTSNGYNIFSYKYIHYDSLPNDAKNLKVNGKEIYKDGYTIISLLNTIETVGPMTLRLNSYDFDNNDLLYSKINFNNYPQPYTNSDAVLTDPGIQNSPIAELNIYINGEFGFEPSDVFKPIFHVAGKSKLINITRLYNINIEPINGTIVNAGEIEDETCIEKWDPSTFD